MSIAQVTLGTGKKMPIVAFGSGTAWFKGYANNNCLEPTRMPELVKMTQVALEKGFYHLDSAEVYGNELDVGDGITNFLKSSGKKRSDLFITSKVYANYDNVEEGLKRILERLKLDYLDLYLIHAPFKNRNVKEIWSDMEALVSKGLVHHIGVSNFRISDLEAILKDCKIKPILNEIEFHPYLQQPSLLKYCKDNGILVTSYGGLAPIVYKKDGPLNPLISELAQKYKTTEGGVLLQWNLSHVDGAITTSSKPERLDEILSSLSVKISEEDLKKIDTLGATCNYRKFWTSEYQD